MNKKSFTFGLGFGIIVLSIVFYGVNYFDNKNLLASYSKEVEIIEMSDDDVVQRAVELGMLTQDDLDTAISNVEPIIETVVSEKELTDDQIIEKAYALGMIFFDAVNNINDIPLEGQDGEPDEPEDEPEDEVGYTQFISIKIEGGMSAGAISRLLQQKGVVDNSDTFQSFLINRGVTTILNAGTFIFPIDSSYEDTLDVLRRRKKF